MHTSQLWISQLMLITRRNIHVTLVHTQTLLEFCSKFTFMRDTDALLITMFRLRTTDHNATLA